jgi:hypothetical protein
MKRFIVSFIILLALAQNCLSSEPVSISQETGMAVLTRLSDNPAGNTTNNTSSNLTQIISINTTSQPPYEPEIASSGASLSSSPPGTKKAAGDLWSWGKIPIGFELNESGKLVRLTDEEWKPSV